MNEVKSAVITAAYVNPPKQGRKNGTIKDASEILYLAKPPILAQFQPGGQYKINYEEYVINGTSFKEIKSAEQVGGAASGGNPSAGARRTYGQDEGLAERIFVCGAVNATLGNPNVKPYELAGMGLVELVNKYRKVWQLTFGGGVTKAADDDMSDEIPF